MKTVSDIEEIRKSLLNIFPDAVRGSVAKSRWGNGRKQLHLCYWIASDTVGGLIVQAIGSLIYFIEWDTNSGYERLFAESDIDTFVERVKEMYIKEKHTISRTVSLPTPPA